MKTFNDLVNIVRTARDPFKGKPTKYNTRVRIAKGTKDTPEVMAVKFYNTDVLLYYPDGSIDVVEGWEDSQMTNECIRDYAGIHRYNQPLPTFNGRLPSPQKTYCVSKGWGKKLHVVSRAHHTHIRFKPSGEIDLDSVRPLNFEVIDKPRELRQVMNKARAICKRIEFQQALGFKFEKMTTGRFEHWLAAQIDTPLEEIDLTGMPTGGIFKVHPTDTINPLLSLPGVSSFLCRERGLTKTIELKTFER